MDRLSVSDHATYYDSYWTKRTDRLNTHEVLRLAEVLRAIALILEKTGNRPLRICDLGCGRGWLSHEIAKFGSVTGVDLSEAGIDIARRRWTDVSFCTADITTWRPSENFDIVLSSEVIEHVPDQSAFAGTVKHLLRKGGYLILTTPNRNVKKNWEKSGHDGQLVEQWLSPRGLRGLFSDMEVLAHDSFVHDFSYSGINRFMSAPKLLALIRSLGAMSIYDTFRNLLRLGLYQIIVGRYQPQ